MHLSSAMAIVSLLNDWNNSQVSWVLQPFSYSVYIQRTMTPSLWILLEVHDRAAQMQHHAHLYKCNEVHNNQSVTAESK